MTPQRRDILGLACCIALALIAVLAVPGCQGARPAPPTVPAQVEADRLGKLAEDDALAAAGALAQADQLDRQALAAVGAAEQARLKAEADVARMRAAIAQARADAASDLRRDAQARATAERAELQALAERSAADAAKLEADKALARDRRWGGIGIGGCIAAAIGLSIIGLPPSIAIGAPAAVAGGLLWVVGWSSVPWLAQAVGLAIAGALLVALAALAVYLARLWQRHADDATDLGRAEADARSLAAQPAWLRPLITRILGS